MRFREHRGGLAESMETLVELPDRKALVEHCQRLLEPYSFTFPDHDLVVRPYHMTPDTRIGWQETYLVWIKGYGVMGMTDKLV